MEHQHGEELLHLRPRLRLYQSNAIVSKGCGAIRILSETFMKSDFRPVLSVRTTTVNCTLLDVESVG